MGKLTRMLLICFLIGLASVGVAAERLTPSGYVWQPNGWVYVVYGATHDYAYSLEDNTWFYILDNPSNGPWTYSSLSVNWYNYIFGDWNYFMMSGGEYYYYNMTIGWWYYNWIRPQSVWCCNMKFGRWEVIY